MKRFPEDFMFELTKDELKSWRSQIVTSNSDKMGLRYSPMAFAEQGVQERLQDWDGNRRIIPPGQSGLEKAFQSLSPERYTSP
jgi:hypothetical protein